MRKLTLTLTLALMFPEDVQQEVCDASEQQETALHFLESASTFASTLAVLGQRDGDGCPVFIGCNDVISE